MTVPSWSRQGFDLAVSAEAVLRGEKVFRSLRSKGENPGVLAF